MNRQKDTSDPNQLKLPLLLDRENTAGSRRLNMEFRRPYGLLLDWIKAQLEAKSESEIFRRAYIAYDRYGVRISSEKLPEIESFLDSQNNSGTRRIHALVSLETRQRLDHLTKTESATQAVMTQKVLFSMLPTVFCYSSNRDPKVPVPPVLEINAINEILQPAGLRLKSQPGLTITTNPTRCAIT